ncbi:MAG: NUDIX hydrolase [Limisphaerales bacterium]
MSAEAAPAPWPQLSSRLAGDFRIFRVRSDLKRSPRTGREHDFFVLEAPDWVNVIAVTPDERLVMVEQYRHGTNTVELEVPGGVMDATDASPLETAVRELREETGYEGGAPRRLGGIAANPAILNNTCHTVLLTGCTRRHDVQFDSGEDLVTRLVPLADVPGLVAAGRIRHSLAVVAWYHYELAGRGLGLG